MGVVWPGDTGVVDPDVNRYIPGFLQPCKFFFFSPKQTVGYAHARERRPQQSAKYGIRNDFSVDLFDTHW